MSLTLEAAVAAVERQPSDAAHEVAQVAARAALLGARGNSGVILSQILAGVAAGVALQALIDRTGICRAAQEAVRHAYAAVSEPVEGTMLTATAAVANAVQAAVGGGQTGLETLAAAAQAARDAVARTPDLLPKLRQAGVVDAGAEGLAVIVDGILRAARGEPLELSGAPEIVRPSNATLEEDAHVLEERGYCTNFLVRGVTAGGEQLRPALLELGTSVVLAAADDLLKVHLHTEHPGLALEAGAGLGELTDIEITNMRDQVAGLRAQEQPAVESAPAGAAVVAVVPSTELAAVFGGFGARTIIGGATMNPSVAQLQEAIEATGAGHVFVLPNNANILLTAREAARLSGRSVTVIPTTTVPQGVAAAVAFLADRPDAENAQAMEAAARTVTTIEVTTAARDTDLQGQRVAAGQPLALVDGSVTATGNTAEAAALTAALHAFTAEHTLITVYIGAGVARTQVDWLKQQLAQHLASAQLEQVQGGQSHYPFILALE